MAELPRYRPLGVTIQPLPGVDFAAAGRARAAAFNEIARGLDMISKYAYEKQQYQAAAKGQRYGAEKAPTQAQLEEAKKEGADIAEMLPGDDYTVFGRAARKTSLDIIIDQSEMEARKSLTALRLEADQTDMPATELSAKINGLISGYSSNLYKLNPAAGSKFQAAMSTVGNTALLSHSQSLAKKAEKRQEVVALASMDSIINEGVAETIKAGTTFNQETAEVVTMNERLGFLREKIATEGYYVGDKALVKQGLAAFDRKVVQVKTGAVADFVLEDPIKNTDDLLQGKQLSNPHIQDIVNNMNDAERREAVKLSIDLADKQRSRDAQIETANRRKRVDAVDDLLPEIADAKIRGETDRLYGLLGRLRELDGAKYESIASAIHTEGGIDDAEVVAGLNRLALNDQLTFEDINTAAKNRQISSSTHLRLLSDLDRQRNEDFKFAVDYAKDALGYPITNKLNFTPEDEIAAQKVAKLRNELRLAKRRNPALDSTEFMINRVKEIQAETTYTTEQIKQAGVAVKGLATKLKGLGYSVDRDSDWEDIQSALTQAVSEQKFDPREADGLKKSFTILGSQ
jgi:hypothetical protein